MGINYNYPVAPYCSEDLPIPAGRREVYRYTTYHTLLNLKSAVFVIISQMSRQFSRSLLRQSKSQTSLSLLRSVSRENCSNSSPWSVSV